MENGVVIREATPRDLRQIRKLHFAEYKEQGLFANDETNKLGELNIYPEYDIDRSPPAPGATTHVLYDYIDQRSGALRRTIAVDKTVRTKTWIAECGNECVGTISLTFDCDDGVGSPLLKEFPEETILARASATVIAYMWRFAVKKEFRGRVAHLLFAAAKEAALLDLRVGWVLCIVHPRHVGFYKRAGFFFVTEKPSTTGLDKAPAVLLCIDTSKIEYRIDNAKRFDAVSCRTGAHIREVAPVPVGH